MTGQYERLSNLDTSFIALESPTTHMHVAALATFEAGPLLTDDGGIDIDRIRALIASKLHLIPRYRQRLAFVPVERHPVWVDDEHFNIEYHVRHESLPLPGGDQQLMALMGRLTSQQLDRSKPLWEISVVEGLADDRFALISKTHHSMIDGISGVDIMTVLLSMGPTGEVEPGPAFVPRPAPEGSELVIRETARRIGDVMGSVRSISRITSNTKSVAFDAMRRARAVSYSLGSGWLSTATDTALNGKIGPNRRFGTLAIPLDQVKLVKNTLGGSVNDVVLATVAGGVRSYLQSHGDRDPAQVDFRVMAPVSVRSKDERGTMGNQVAMWLATLPVGEADPGRRLAMVHDETVKLKRTDQALGAATLVRLSTGAPTTVVSLAARLAQGVRPFNMTVTNVPGPQFPLYMLGSRMLETYPLVPLWEGHGAGIALFSYAGCLYLGFNADWDVVPDLQPLIDAVDASFRELMDCAAAADEPVVGRIEDTRAAKGTSRDPGSSTAASAETTNEGTAEKAAKAKESSSGTKPRKRPPLGG